MDNATLAYARLGAMVMEFWPESAEIEIGDLHDMAVKAGVLEAVPGGFNPDVHEDTAGVCPEPGDKWFMNLPLPDSLRGVKP